MPVAVAQAAAPHHGHGYAALLQVLERFRRPQQRLVVDAAGRRQDHPVVQGSASGGLGRAGVGPRRRTAVAQALQRLAEAEPLGPAHEVDDVAAGLAAEAEEAGGLGVDDQARVLVLVEGAAAHQVRPAGPHSAGRPGAQVPGSLPAEADPRLGAGHGRPRIFVTEGAFDYLTGIGWGLAICALLGTQVRAERLAFLERARRVLIVFDNDGPGREAASALAGRVGSRARVVELPEGVKDLNDLARQPGGRGTFFRLVKEADRGGGEALEGDEDAVETSP